MWRVFSQQWSLLTYSSLWTLLTSLDSNLPIYFFIVGLT
jgi:hypothetical protein